MTVGLALALTVGCGPSTTGSTLGDGDEDLDGDGFTTNEGDCDDTNPLVFPGAVEAIDRIDNDCDGLVDNNLLGVDDDGDGYSEDEGDCDDGNALVGPDAVEVDVIEDQAGNLVAEGVDNDCDGNVDEGVAPCDAGLLAGSDDAADFAKAIDVCQGMVGAQWLAGIADQRAMVTGFGGYYASPLAGERMALLSSGRATAPVTDYQGLAGTTYPGYDPANDDQILDPVILRLTLKVPPNATGFSFDFAFFTEEFAGFVGSSFNDRFMAGLTSSGFNGNVSFDHEGNPISVNAAFMLECSQIGDRSYYVETNVRAYCQHAERLAGTGFESAGGTGVLRTEAPATPGETIVLDLVMGDVYDHIYDSSVFIDNFQWVAQGVEAPSTNPS